MRSGHKLIFNEFCADCAFGGSVRLESRSQDCSRGRKVSVHFTVQGESNSSQPLHLAAGQAGPPFLGSA